MSQKLYESYEWVVPFETSTIQGKKVIIRGHALHATMSSNLRQYVKDELIEFGQTLAGKYIDVNHEYSIWREHKRKYDAGETAIPPGPRPKLKGHVIDSKYNHLNGFVEYVAEVNHPEYAQKLIDRERMTVEAYMEKWSKTPIKTVSVDANFRFKRSLGDVNGREKIEPHGIIGNGLSMVEDPEVAGVEGTDLEVLEIRETQRLEAQLKILQNLLRDKNILTEVVGDAGERTLQRVEEVKHVETDERKAIKKFKLSETEWVELTPEVRLSYLNQLHEQDDECPEGQHRNEEGECVPNEVTEQEECPEGQHRNEEGECVPDEATEQDGVCPEGQHRNEDGVCVADEEPITEQDEEPCPEGEHRNEEGLCVPDEAPLPATIEITKLPILRTKELHLGEPFADYTSFEDCVAKNSEKEDPEAYCASIQQSAEGETLSAKLEETKRLHRQKVQGKSISHLTRRQESFEKRVGKILHEMDARERLIIEAYNSLVKNSPCSASVKKLYQRQRKHDKSIRDTYKTLNVIGRDIKANRTQINGVMKSFAETLDTVTDIKETMSKTLEEMMTTFKNDLPLLAKAEDITSLSERLNKVEADNGVAELKESLEALKKEYPTMTEISKLFKDKEDKDKATLTETDDTANTLKETMVKMQAEIDNLKDKSKNPDFKAGAPPPESSQDDEVTPSSSRMDPAIG